MDPRWFRRPDCPNEYEINLRARLMAAIRAIPCGDLLSEEDVEGKALALLSASNFGRNDELPRNRNASLKASGDQLIKLHDLCEKLINHINSLNKQAISALILEECNPFNLTKGLAEARESARHAFGEIDAPDRVAGAHPKIEADQVGTQAGLIYEYVRGVRATYTSDPFTSEVSGYWPNFLAEVFDALGVKASAGAQAKSISKKLAEIGPI